MIDTITIVFGILSVVYLIVFFVMASNIAKLKKQLTVPKNRLKPKLISKIVSNSPDLKEYAFEFLTEEALLAQKVIGFSADGNDITKRVKRLNPDIIEDLNISDEEIKQCVNYIIN